MHSKELMNPQLNELTYRLADTRFRFGACMSLGSLEHSQRRRDLEAVTTALSSAAAACLGPGRFTSSCGAGGPQDRRQIPCRREPVWRFQAKATFPHQGKLVVKRLDANCVLTTRTLPGQPQIGDMHPSRTCRRGDEPDSKVSETAPVKCGCDHVTVFGPMPGQLGRYCERRQQMPREERSF